MSQHILNEHCLHCRQPLEKEGDWFNCTQCGVNFCLNGNYLHIKWERQIGDWYVALNLYPDGNRTVLCAHHKKYLDSNNLADSDYTRIVVEHCMTNITAENCVAKMKLLLIWQ